MLELLQFFTYDFQTSIDNFKEKGIDLVVLCDYNHLLDYAQDERMFENEMLKTLKEWRTDPVNWG